MKPIDLIKESPEVDIKKPGVYLILNILSGKGYVGQTRRTLHKRFIVHRHTLKKGIHRNPYLQASYNKNGPLVFNYIPLENCSIGELTSRETYYHGLIDEELRYNLAGIKDTHVMSQATRERISKTLKGRKKGPMSEEQKKLFSEIRTGKPNLKLRGRKATDEQRKKLSEAHIGKPNNSSTKFKKGESQWTGRKHSEETKLKMSDTAKKRRANGTKKN